MQQRRRWTPKVGECLPGTGPHRREFTPALLDGSPHECQLLREQVDARDVIERFRTPHGRPDQVSQQPAEQRAPSITEIGKLWTTTGLAHPG